MKLLNKTALFILVFLLVTGSLFAAPPKKVSVQVLTSPAGAMFQVGSNTARFGPTPANYTFRIGVKYDIIFYKDNYKPEKVTWICDGNPLFAELTPIAGSQEITTPQTTTTTIKQTGKLYIDSNITGARVFINDENYGTTPYSVVLQNGTYEVKVKMGGYKNYKQMVTIAGSDQRVQAILKSKQLLKIELPRGAQIWIDGEKQDVNWKKVNKKEKTRVFVFYPEEATSNSVHKVKIRYNGLVYNGNISLPKGKAKDAPVYKIGLTLITP
jgi:RNase P/RNase MRP subunit p29